MVLANVAAAETLNAKKSPLLFRVHEEPPVEKIDSLRETAESAGFTLAKGQVMQTRHLNALLNAAAGTDQQDGHAVLGVALKCRAPIAVLERAVKEARSCQHDD